MKKSFSISPRILLHLGEDLIKNESIALLELVKNSYDACAKECIIKFQTNSEGKMEKIIIKDDGFGMNKNIIENVWLKIGTDYKLKRLEPNSCERIPLGEKGIGRLGVHKIGNEITLISKMNNSDEVEVYIDWKDLHYAKEIKEFEIEINENKNSENFRNKTGTKITIEDLKSSWDKRELREVYRNLTSLNTPFSNNNDLFRVKIKSNSDLFEGLPDFNEIKKSALYYGHCKMDKDKITDFKYEFKPWETLIKVDKGRTLLLKDLISEDLNICDEKGKLIDLDFYKIGPIEFDLIIFEMDSQIFSYINSERKIIRDYLRENGGIRVYRDGIRVYDYGERDNDWLGIDLKRVHRVGGNVSNNIILGSVKLNRKNSFGLREKTNREGFIENNSYKAFVSAVNYALSIFVRERNVDKAILTTLYKKHKVIEPVLSDLTEVIEIVENKVRPDETKNELLKYLYRINDQYVEVKEILIKSANAGLNLSVVIHEIEKLIADLTGSIERDEKEKAVFISKMLEKIIRGYSLMIKKSEFKKDNLSKIIQLALENYEFRFRDHKIKIVSNWNEVNKEAYFSEAEAISVLTNLLDNSIYWLSYAKKENRIISVYVTDQFKNYLSIIVSDNGPGFNIPTDIAIQPFITGKPHSLGSGLGLHVASEMMKAMKGKLIFLDKNEIDFPKNNFESKEANTIIGICFKKEK